MKNNILIIKANGEQEAFDSQKLRDSLNRARANPVVVGKIVTHIESEIKDGMSTKEIYRHAFELLIHDLLKDGQSVDALVEQAKQGHDQWRRNNNLPPEYGK